jgi:hypothetical protein
MRWSGFVVGGFVLAAAGGCTHASPAPQASFVQPAASAPAWAEPSAYAFVLTRGCSATLARYQVTVRDGAVANYRRLDKPETNASADVDLGPVTGDDGEEIEVPTLKGLLGIVQTAEDDGNAVTQSFDAADGHPLKVTFENECFSVSDYAVTH